ncbi:Right handed beta helix region [uncultured archaeon]|nr:Right handed beta helix region [uncultured archaeon]
MPQFNNITNNTIYSPDRTIDMIGGAQNNSIWNNVITATTGPALHVRDIYNSFWNNTISCGLGGGISLESNTDTYPNGTNNTFYNNRINCTSGGAAIKANDSQVNYNLFYNNTIEASVWVNDSGSNYYNTTGMGNIYYFANHTPSWSVFDVVDTNNDTWADAGNDRPFNATTVSGYFTGAGKPQDWFPYTSKTAGTCGTLGTAGQTYTLYVNYSTATSCFNVTAANVVLDCNGYSVQGADANGSYGVYSNQFNTTVRNCHISGFEAGLWLEDARNASVYNNTFDPSYCLKLKDTNDSVFANLTCLNTSNRAIWLTQGSNRNSFTNFSIDVRSSGHGIYVDGGANNSFDCMGNSIIGMNTSSHYGVYSDQIGTTVQNCQISNFETGIYLNGATYGLIQNTSASSTRGYGIYLYTGANYNRIINSNATSSAYSGLSIRNSLNNNVSGAQISGYDNTYGALMFYNSGNNSVISNSTINGNGGTYAVTMRSATNGNNTFYNNTILNANTAIFASAASGNSFYLNNITASVWVNDATGSNYYNVSGSAPTQTAGSTGEGGTVSLSCPAGTTIQSFTSTYGANCASACPVSCGTCTIGSPSCSVTYNNANCGDCHNGCSKNGNLNLTCGLGNRGNIYYFANGTPSWNVYSLVDQTGDGWADTGYNVPLNSSVSEWSGSGADYHPYTTVLDTYPNLTSLTIGPNPAYKTSTLYCTINATDNEQANLTAYWEWYRNGTNQTALAGNMTMLNATATNLTQTVSSSLFNKSDTWMCRAKLWDGTLYSNWTNSSDLQVSNSLPNLQDMSLTNLTQNSLSLCRVNVTDGDGQQDLKWVNFTIVNPNGTLVINNVNGTREGNTTFYDSGTFNLSVDGYWNCTATAVDYSNASVNLTGSFQVIREWQKYYGLTSGQLQLGSGAANYLLNWSATYGQVVYVAEPSVDLNFTYLYPLGVCPNGSLHTSQNDFALADQLLGLSTASSRSIEGLFDANNNSIADTNASFKVFGRTVNNVPVAKIANSSAFSTGIFWQGTAGSTLCYDGAKDLVFAVTINKAASGTYGASDYELMIPQELARYKSPSNAKVNFYGEYRGQND